MSQRRSIFRRSFPWLAPLLLILAVACNDSPTEPSNPPPTGGGQNPPPASQSAFLRAAQLTEDARVVDLALNGNVVARAIPYPGASGYVSVDPGQYRVQFFPTGNVRTVLMETTLTLSAGQAVTVAMVGLSDDIVTLFDPALPTGSQAHARLMNAVPDYPKPFDLKIVNGPLVIQNVAYPTASGYADLVPGLYNFEIHRAGTTETVAISEGHNLGSGQSYTVFVVGTLRRDNIEVLVASDAR